MIPCPSVQIKYIEMLPTHFHQLEMETVLCAKKMSCVKNQQFIYTFILMNTKPYVNSDQTYIRIF